MTENYQSIWLLYHGHVTWLKAAERRLSTGGNFQSLDSLLRIYTSIEGQFIVVAVQGITAA